MKQIGTETGKLIAISDNGFGGYVFLDTLSQYESRIAVIGPDDYRTYDMSLYDFFVKISAGKLAI
ncbi:hypothetical protein QWE_23664 [Agrobacterium albertimagni AOL15]|uniref:Uncharacterized protein n=1 Tax=Agrobacterium albertimagni AOL15 TaxID=1156935 RepID=K2P7P0_9HYPH|nr:hypothetical protein QWE_23664 [Agrobacterium albertimagni AOL15]